MTTPTNARRTTDRPIRYREKLADALEQIGNASAIFPAAAQLRADEFEIVQLRANVEQAREAIDALRAENEALRTVTEEDVIRTSARTGVMPVDVRKALQSFIRSKESRRG